MKKNNIAIVMMVCLSCVYKVAETVHIKETAMVETRLKDIGITWANLIKRVMKAQEKMAGSYEKLGSFSSFNTNYKDVTIVSESTTRSLVNNRAPIVLGHTTEYQSINSNIFPKIDTTTLNTTTADFIRNETNGDQTTAVVNTSQPQTTSDYLTRAADDNVTVTENSTTVNVSESNGNTSYNGLIITQTTQRVDQPTQDSSPVDTPPNARSENSTDDRLTFNTNVTSTVTAKVQLETTTKPIAVEVTSTRPSLNISKPSDSKILASGDISSLSPGLSTTVKRDTTNATTESAKQGKLIRALET